MKSKPIFIDLFCGIGGITQGLIDAGFEVIWAIDNDSKTQETFDKNHSIPMTLADISTISPPNLGLKPNELDLLVGGPPCPTYSLVGRTKINSIEGRDVREDERFELYEYFISYLEVYKPKVFCMENVKGILSAKNRDDELVTDIIKNQIEEYGYNVSIQTVNAADYGVPQHRERVFILGNNLEIPNPDLEDWKTHRAPINDEEKKIKYKNQVIEGIKVTPVFPNFTKGVEKKPWNTITDAILDLPPVSPEGTIPPKKASNYYIPAISEYQEWVRNIQPSQSWEETELHNHECRGHNMRDLTLYKLLGEGVSWIIGDIPEDAQPYRTDIFKDKYKKQNPLEPSRTIVAHLQKDGNMFIHPREARTITVREAARLQSFKDTFILPKERTHAYRQIGNAVPPLLAQAIGTAIKTELLDTQ